MIACGPDIWLVAGGDHGLGSRLDCSVYAMRTARGLLVFDAGSGLAGDALASSLEAASGGGPVAAIFLTHAHADHSGGAAALTKFLSAPFHAGEATATIVSGGDEAAMSLDKARRAGVYPPDYSFTPCHVARIIRDGETLTFADATVIAIATPGHSIDHHCYLLRRDAWCGLIAGDALFDGGRVTLQDTWDCSVPDTCETVRKLAKFDFSGFLPGHGPFSLAGGKMHVDMALSRVDRLLVPELYV